MLVREVMAPVAGSVSPDESLRDAVETIKSLGLDPIPVTKDGHVAGMLSEQAVMDLIAIEGVGGGMKAVRQIMSKEILCCRDNEEIGEAVDRLDRNPACAGLTRLPVTDVNGTLVGIVTVHDLREHQQEIGAGTTAVSDVSSIDQLVDYDEDRVDHMNDASFPASDPQPAQATAQTRQAKPKQASDH